MDGWSLLSLTLVTLVVIGVGLGLVVWIGRWLIAVVVGGLPWAIRTAFRWTMRTPPDTHGSAHWAREDERADLCMEAPGIVLGQLADGRPLIDASEAHVLVLGPTGSRKSRGVFVPTLERWPGSALVIDLKGELSTLTGEARKAYGDVAVFAPTLAESITVNVMDWIRWDTDQAVGDCQRLATALTTEGGAGDWRQDVRALLTATMFHAKVEGYGHVAGVLAWMTAATLDDRMQRLMVSPSPVVRAQGLQLKSRSDRMRSLVWNAALATLGLWWDPVIARNTATSDLDLLSLPSGLRPCTVFFRLPEGDLLRLRPLLITSLEMFVGRLTDSVPGSQRHELLLALDEFSALGTLPTLQASASYLRGYRTRLLVALQTLRQLRQNYGPDSPLAAQMKTWWCAAPSDPDDAKVISARVGIQTRARLALNTSYFTWSLWTKDAEAEIHTGRPLMTPDEVSRLAPHEVVLLRESKAPIKAVKHGVAVPPVLQDVRRRLPRYAVPAITMVLLLCGLTVYLLLWPAKHTPPPPPTAALQWQPPGKAKDTPSAPAPEPRGPWGLPMSWTNPDAGTPWAIYSQQTTHMGTAKPMTFAGMGAASGLPYGRYETQAECQAALHQQADWRISMLRQQAAVQRRLTVDVVERPSYVAWSTTTGTGAWTQRQTREALCYLVVEAE